MLVFRPVLHLLSLLLLTLGAAMLLPASVDLAEGSDGWQVFAAASALTITFAGALYLSSRGEETRLNIRQAFLLTVLAWALASAFASLPFLLAGLQGVDVADALFEATSGLTTTGATVLYGLDELPRSLLLWRGILQWLGGAAVIIMAVAILPFLQVGGMQLFRSERPERHHVSLRVSDFSILIVECYLSLTFLCLLAYWAAGMSLFDALVHAMATISTGGFSTMDASLGHWPQPAVQWTAVVFMLAGAMPFVLYVQALRGRPLALWRDPQVRWLLALLCALVLYAALRLWLENGRAPGDALTAAAVNVVSVVTTTGFFSENYSRWGNWAVVTFFFLMFLGGCSGSTSGSIKTYRLYVLTQSALMQLKRLTHPNAVLLVLYNRRQIDEPVRSSVAAFVLLFFVTVAALALALAALGLDFVTAISASASAVTNVGPGLGDVVGPTGTYRALPDTAKWLLCLGMLLGRLELFTLLVLVMPRFWRG
ncbi:TrkH family potassium uptake protein [Aquibaculum sediminis]|uniref:TrkH family potassium uptake protein n=1 Tax=Aquibaculum sediminis TaxID=3231907 RepID=UPI0034538DF2